MSLSPVKEITRVDQMIGARCVFQRYLVERRSIHASANPASP